MPHTPGPYFVLPNGFCVAGPFSGVGGEPGQTTAGVAHCGMRLRTKEEAEANAVLFAAAPDLLAACEAAFLVVDQLCTERDDWPAAGNARRLLQGAIAKALEGV